MQCTEESCSYTPDDRATYDELVIRSSDGVTRTRDIVSGGTMESEYRVTVYHDHLEIARVKGRRARFALV